jgi:hypothetical protein
MCVYASTATFSDVAARQLSPSKFSPSKQVRVIMWHNIWDNEVKNNCLLSA